MVRTPEFFHDVKDVDARPETEALAIDRAGKTVTAKHLPSGRVETIPYDQLVIATGSTNRRLPIPGMPCTAKKFEGLRPEYQASGHRDIDATINTRELAYMLQKADIDLKKLPAGKWDAVMEAVPFLLLGAVASGLVEAYVPREKLERRLPRGRLSGTLFGLGLGAVTPCCECGVVYLARRLLAKGLAPGAALAFMPLLRWGRNLPMPLKPPPPPQQKLCSLLGVISWK